MLLLVHHIVGATSQIPKYPFEPFPPLLLLMFLCVPTCYSYCLCFGEVLPPSSLPCRWQISGQSCYCTPPTTNTHHHHLPSLSLMLLLIGCIVAIGSLCCMCHGEVLPYPLPCASGGTPLWLETKAKKKKNCQFICFLIFKNSQIFSFVFSFVLYFYLFFQRLEENLKYTSTILVAKDFFFVTMDTCDYKPYNRLG
jgi:hypothetical protein